MDDDYGVDVYLEACEQRDQNENSARRPSGSCERSEIKVVNRHVYNMRDLSVGGIGIYIGRGTIFGNPYSHKVSFGSYTVKTREEAIEKYRAHMRKEWTKSPELQANMIKLADQYLQGKEVVLICSCKPKACHGDVLKMAIENLAENITDKKTIKKIRARLGISDAVKE